MATTINPAVYWTNVALEANRRDFSVPDGKTAAPTEQGGPTLSSRALAIVHLAMHDAYFSVPPITQPTWFPLVGAPPAGANAETCMVAAAQTALRALYKSADQTAAFDKAVAEFVPASPMAPADMAWGTAVALMIVNERKSDLDNVAPAYGLSNAPYRHRSDPFSLMPQAPHGQRWGNCPAFAVTLQHLAPPPGWTPTGVTPGTFYQMEFTDVLKKGALMGSTRTPEQTVKGIYWAYDGVDKIGTPPRLYCQIALSILDKFSQAPGSTVAVSDYVRMLALITTAMADAGIQAWHWKYEYDLWRPVVGIREADASLGPATTMAGKTMKAHTDWAPLGAPLTNQGKRFTPGFPAYPSGHATFGAAAFQIIRSYAELRRFAGPFAVGAADDIAFEFVSDEYNGTNRDPDGSLRPKHLRKFNNLWEATLENSISRLYLGVHWRFDGVTSKDGAGHAVHADPLPASPADLGNIGGVWLGREIANKLMAGGLKKF